MSPNIARLYGNWHDESQMTDVRDSQFSSEREDETFFSHSWNTIVQNNEALANKLQNHLIRQREKYIQIAKLYDFLGKSHDSPYKQNTDSVETCAHGGNFDFISDDTVEFINMHNLTDSIQWLKIVAPNFFPGANFKIELLPAEEDNSSIVSLKVYGSFTIDEFREKRHRLGQAMLSANYKELYEMISIFQRRINNSGWQEFSALITSVA